MGKHIRLFFWLLAASFFAYDFYLWGGVAAVPGIDEQLMGEAKNSPMATAYMVLGRRINGMVGARESSQAFAISKFPELAPKPTAAVAQNPANPDVPPPPTDAGPDLNVDHFLNAQTSFGSLMYYGAPLLVALSFALHLLREKKVKSLGSG